MNRRQFTLQIAEHFIQPVQRGLQARGAGRLHGQQGAAAVIQHVADHLSADPGFAHDIIDTPEVWGIETFTEKGYTIRLVIKTRPAAQFRVMRELRIRLTESFRTNGITVAGAGRPELWVHDGDEPPAASAKRFTRPV